MTKFISVRFSASATNSALVLPDDILSDIEADWSTTNKKAVGLLRLICASYAIVKSPKGSG
ncbi:hypothetical protein NMB33_06355 [Burkholderia sp. FXe9]|nr:hypothetical protein NMB33_06355 [Burkholderia sp. FXe9]